MNAFPTENEMKVLIEEEINKLNSGEREYFISKLISLQRKTLKWEYGNEEEYQSWVFADLEERNVGVAYCQGGHGATGDTWGLIFFNDDYFGMDAGWYSSLKGLINDGWYQNT